MKILLIGFNKASALIDKGIEKIKNEEKGNLNWTDLGIDTIKELMDNLWELKDAAQSFLNKNPRNQNLTDYANKIINYYSGIKSKLLELKSEIDNYNKKFPEHKIKNIEELINSKIKDSVKISSLKEEIINLSKC